MRRTSPPGPGGGSILHLTSLKPQTPELRSSTKGFPPGKTPEPEHGDLPGACGLSAHETSPRAAKSKGPFPAPFLPCCDGAGAVPPPFPLPGLLTSLTAATADLHRQGGAAPAALACILPEHFPYPLTPSSRRPGYPFEGTVRRGSSACSRRASYPRSVLPLTHTPAAQQTPRPTLCPSRKKYPLSERGSDPVHAKRVGHRTHPPSLPHGQISGSKQQA